MKNFIGWILEHRYLAGVAAIATIVGLIFQLLPPSPPKPCDFFNTDFTVSSPENSDFNQVKSKFSVEKAAIITSCASRDATQSIQRLANHYGEQRALYYSGYKLRISDTGSATKGSSGGSKRASMKATCRSPLIVDKSTFANNGHGGCYSDEPQRTSISGTVSQTGRGRSECTISAECVYDRELIPGYISSEVTALN